MHETYIFESPCARPWVLKSPGLHLPALEREARLGTGDIFCSRVHLGTLT